MVGRKVPNYLGGKTCINNERELKVRKMNRFQNPKVIGQLRHLLTSLGPLVAIMLAVDDPMAIVRAVLSDWGSLVGLVMAVIGFVLSWIAVEKAE